MTTSLTGTAAPERIRRRIWVGLVALALYVFFAAVIGNIFGDLAGDDDTLDFVLSHYIPLPILIVLGLLFVRWSRWEGVWTETPTPALRPRRLWLIAIPVFAVALPLAGLFGIDWADSSATLILLIVIGTLMVGFGEELYVRGILVSAVRGRHGELVTLLVTSLAFAAAHIVGSVWSGLPFEFIAFQVSGLALSGIAYYWIRRVTGRLWVGILVHALTDAVLYISEGTPRPGSADASNALSPGESFQGAVQVLLIIASLISIISVAREDKRNRKERETPQVSTV